MDYSGINAKIKAMRGRLLTPGDYWRLCQAGSVGGVARALGEYPAYSAAVSRALGTEVHRDIVEQKILLSLSENYARVYNFISDFNIRKYLRAHFLSSELSVIKLLLCMVYDEREVGYSVQELDLLIGADLNADTEKLKAAKSPEEFIRALSGTSFYSMLTDMVSSRSSLFDIEMQLDLYYYMNLWKHQKQCLDTKNRRIMERINGARIDMRNIMWVHRLKKYYNMSGPLVYAYLIPISHRLKRGHLIRMAQCGSLAELDAEIAASPYGGGFTGYGGLEAGYYRRMARMYNTASMMSPNSLAGISGYMFFKKLELKNLTSLLEGVRYKLSPKDIMSYLNFPGKTEARKWSSG